MKIKAIYLAIILLVLLATTGISLPVQAAPTNGPRVDEALIKIYGSDTALFTAFETCDIDMVDSPIGPYEVTKWSEEPYSDWIALDFFRENGMHQFDINNNITMLTYPDWPSPTSYIAFRQAIAHIVDKPFIVNTIVGGYGAILEGPVMPWTSWYNPAMATYPYNPTTACTILFNNGWRDNANPNSGSNVHFPTGHPQAGNNLEDVMTNGPHTSSDPGLIFYRRSDITSLNQAGQLLIYGDATHQGLEDIGIPVDDNSVPTGTSDPHVMYECDFHIYTGSWTLGRDPCYLYDLWHSAMMNWDPSEFSWNYNSINQILWDNNVEDVKFATSITAATAASNAACIQFGTDVFFIPLWTTAGYMAHKKDWHVLNVELYSIRNTWNIHACNKPSIGPTGGQVRWGFQNDVQALNPIFSQQAQDWQILDNIFDTLIRFNPLNIAVDMPWMASGWTIGTWTNPTTGLPATQVKFTLRNGINWVNSTNGVILGTVTVTDVIDSFQYVYDQVGWNYPLVSDIYVLPSGLLDIGSFGNEITFHMSQQSIWALHQLGSLPIIPSFIYSGIADAHGFTAGNLGEEATLIGSGPFYYVSYTTGVSGLLRANRNYINEIVPNVDTDPVNIKLDWGIFRANPKEGDWTVNVLDLIIVANALGWTGQPGDIPADITKDGTVNVLDLIVVATNLGASWF